MYKMAAAMRVLSLIAKVGKNGCYFQRVPSEIGLNTNKRLFSSSRAVYLAADGIESNPFYEKYAERIKVVRNEIKEGKLEEKSAEEKFCLDSRAQGEAEKFKQKLKQNATEKFLLGSKPLSSKGETSVYGEKTLASIMHMDKIVDKSTEEIRQIWREYHREKDCISAAIPSNVYNRMEERFLKFPLFIYPLPREQGFEFMYAEFKDHKCYFTSLLHYQTRGENAPWSLAMRHFTDLREKKGIVLMVGEVDTNELIGWYNEQLKDKAFALRHPDDTLGLSVVSTPLMFDNGFKPFIRQSSYAEGGDALDQFMTHVYNKVKSEFPQHEIETIHDSEMSSRGTPKVLVQIATHVAGGAYYYQRGSVSKERDPWDESQKIFGVSIHPKYGGWFAMRGVIIFKDLLTPELPRKEPDDVVKGDEKKIDLLEKANFHWKDWSYRDVVPADLKYSEEQKKYFATLPANRKELLESYRQEGNDSSM